MIINKEGVIEDGATQITKKFFNTNPVGKKLYEVLKLNGEKKENLKRWIKNIYRGMLQFRDLKNLVPLFFENDGIYIEIDYKPIYFEDKKKGLDKIICIATDKTNEIKLERQLELDKQNVEFIKNCLQNPVEFVDLLDDSYSLLDFDQK